MEPIPEEAKGETLLGIATPPWATATNLHHCSNDGDASSSSRQQEHVSNGSNTTPSINIPPLNAFASRPSRPARLECDDTSIPSSSTQQIQVSPEEEEEGGVSSSRSDTSASTGGVFNFAQMYSPSGWKYSRLDRSPTNLSDIENRTNDKKYDGQHDDDDDDDEIEHVRMVYSSRGDNESRSMTLMMAAALLAVVLTINVAHRVGTRLHRSNASDNVEGVQDVWGHVSPAVVTSSTAHPKSNADNGPYKSGRSNPHVFVCITGQLPRLELANKIETLFMPWSEQHGATFDVALVLTTTDHESVKRLEDRDQEYYTVQEVYDELSSLGSWINVLNDDVDLQTQNPILNPHYTNQRAHDTTMTAPQILERVQNHVRQFESLADCHRHMSMKGTPDSYDIVHRIREDSGYYRTPDLVHIHDVLTSHPMTIMSSDCQFHGGINDRGSFVSPRAAFDYFVGPILGMYLRPLPPNVRNTEQFLMTMYGPTCRLVLTDSFQIFRLWEKVEDGGEADDNGDSDDKNDADDTVGSISTLLTHITEMEFSRSDLRCLENRHPGDPKYHSSHTRAKFCHDYDDGNTYCIFYDKSGIDYNPGKSGLLRTDTDDRPSARLRKDWTAEEKEDPADTGGFTFDLLDIGWDSSSSTQLEKILKIQTDESTIEQKKAERKKKRMEWKKKHKDDRE